MAEPADQILTIGLSAVAGYGGKMAQDWWTARRARRQADRELWSEHKQQLYLPLLGAVRELETRLSELADVNGGRSALPFTSTSLSRDFRELYLLSPEEIPDLLASDGDQPRRDDRVVQRLRKRMCYELNFATSSPYRTGRYLACARLVHRHLSGGSTLAPADQEGLDRLTADVGAVLQGPTGGRDLPRAAGVDRRDDGGRRRPGPLPLRLPAAAARAAGLGAVHRPVDRTYPLAEVPEAIRHLVEGHGRGKVVITVTGPEAGR
jgi:hypothetical protein